MKWANVYDDINGYWWLCRDGKPLVKVVSTTSRELAVLVDLLNKMSVVWEEHNAPKGVTGVVNGD